MLKQNEHLYIISGKRVKVLFFIFLIFLLTSTVVYAQQFVNGDFEMGDFIGWTVTGPHNANVEQHQGSYCGHIHINSGSASGGGGQPNSQWQMVGQTLNIPDVSDTLNFYMEVSGSNWHNGGHVWLMDADSVGTYFHLFYTGGGGGSAQSYPWEFHQVNIEPWAGREATIYFAGQNSNGYGDHVCDIYFDNISVSPTIPDTIPPTVNVDAPNGGEVWIVGDTYQIEWTADDDMGIHSDSVFYSIDNGVNWTFIASHSGNPQGCEWLIPNTPSEECLVKVKVFDASNNFAEDISDGTFIISYVEPPPLTYAVIIKQSTYNDPDWQAVADALLARYGGQLFIWNSSLSEIQNDVAQYYPSHIGFICDMSTASPNFIQSYIWPFTRALDTDVYCDAVWGIITGYEAQDALNLVSGPTGFEVKTCIGGTTSCNVNYYTQGISSSEATYNQYFVKYPDALEVVEFNDGPTDRTEWLVTMVNEGVDIFNYDPVDIFVTSGHGNHDQWQLHYPTSGQEGFFRSSNGQAYGDPYSGSDINIDSDTPKIFFGLGNCNIGQIMGGSSMAPSWIHTAGAYQYTGYLIGEGSSSCQHGGTKAYFYKVSRSNTWAESYFLSNIALKFDMLNSTPGASPNDLNGSALYGDPGMDIKMSNDGVFIEPLFTNELTINEGTERDTVTYKITMNREGNPGFTSKWGERHPAIILPFQAEDIQIIYTDAMAVVVEDNFALMYIWYQGQPSLAEGETREVIFTCNHTVTDIDEQIIPEITKARLYQNYPNPFNPTTMISFSVAQTSSFVTLDIYNIKGQKVKTLLNEKLDAGTHQVIWDGKDENGKSVSSSIYFYQLKAGKDFIQTKRMILLK
jgi:hypothetical protein